MTTTANNFKSAPSTPSGLKKALVTRFHAPLASRRTKPVSLGTGGGQAAVSQPPTVAPPPNTLAAVTQQINSSEQLSENTQTGAGIGANKSSVPVTVKVKTSTYYALLGLLAVALLAAFAWDRGKL